MNKSLSLLAFGCVAFSLSACASSIPQPDVALTDARTQLLNVKRPVPDSMRLNTRVDYVDGVNDKRVVGQDLIISESADGHMRITISAFDKAISTLVTDGVGFSLIDVSQNVYVTGHATPENIAQILPVQLSAADLHRVIKGDYPIDGLTDDALENAEFAWDAKAGGYKLALPMKDGKTQNVYQSWPDGDIFKISVTDNNNDTVYLYEASDFATAKSNGQSYRFPDKIVFRLPKHKTDVRLRIDKRDLNVEFSEAVFRLLPPNGARIIALD